MATAILSIRWRWRWKCIALFLRSALWIVPNAGHGPVFFGAAAQFAQNALAFFRTSTDRQP